jgi:hypothetical protein
LSQNLRKVVIGSSLGHNYTVCHKNRKYNKINISPRALFKAYSRKKYFKTESFFSPEGFKKSNVVSIGEQEVKLLLK